MVNRLQAWILIALLSFRACALPGSCCSSEAARGSTTSVPLMSGNYRISDCGDSTQQIVDALEAAWNNIVQVTSMNVEAATASTGPIKSVDYALEAFFSGVSPANVQRLLLTLKDGDKVGGPPAQYPSLQCVQEGQPWGLSEHVRRCTSNTWIFGFVSDEIVYICPQFFNLPPFVEGTKNCPTIAYGGGLFQGDEDLFVLYQPFTLINLLADLYIGPSSFPRARGLWPMDLEWNVCANLEYGDAQNNPKNYQLFIAFVQQGCTQIPTKSATFGSAVANCSENQCWPYASSIQQNSDNSPSWPG